MVDDSREFSHICSPRKHAPCHACSAVRLVSARGPDSPTALRETAVRLSTPARPPSACTPSMPRDFLIAGALARWRPAFSESPRERPQWLTQNPPHVRSPASAACSGSPKVVPVEACRERSIALAPEVHLNAAHHDHSRYPFLELAARYIDKSAERCRPLRRSISGNPGVQSRRSAWSTHLYHQRLVALSFLPTQVRSDDTKLRAHPLISPQTLRVGRQTVDAELRWCPPE